MATAALRALWRPGTGTASRPRADPSRPVSPKRDRAAVEVEVDDSERAVRRRPHQVGAARPADLRGHRIVASDHPAEAGPGHELLERRPHGVEGSPVVEVVRFDIGDDGHVRRQRQEGPVALVGLDHQPLPLVPDGVGPDLVDVPADEERRPGPASTRCRASMDAVVVFPWVPATARQRLSEAMAARTSGPGQHGDPASPGLDDLGVVLGDGRGHGDHVGGTRHWRRHGRWPPGSRPGAVARSPPTP